MRRVFWVIVICLALSMIAPASAEQPELILFTVYEQCGWGDALQVGCVDSDGGLWALSGSASALGWPSGVTEQMEYLSEPGRLTCVGSLDSERIFELKSLVYGVEAQEGKPVPAACDAGTEASYAILYDRDGNAEAVLLGMSGDDMFENMDPDAQALYLALWELFPGITHYSGALGMGPAGFQAVPVWAFCGYSTVGLDTAEVRAAYMDCEAGPIDLELTEQEVAQVKKIARDAMVTGKDNGYFTTGGTVVFSFYDGEGELLLSLELYSGLLVCSDGMYSLEM